MKIVTSWVLLCALFMLPDDESEDEDRLEMKETWSLEYEMTFNSHHFQLVGKLRYKCWCECSDDDWCIKTSMGDLVSKIAIKEYGSNEWKQLNASFGDYVVKQ